MSLNSIQMERAVVASIVLDPKYALPVVNRRLVPEDFEDAFSREVLSVYQRAHDDGRPMDSILLEDALAHWAGIEYGIQEQIADLLQRATARNVEAYCESVKEAAQERRYQYAINNAAGPEDLTARLAALNTEKGSDVADSFTMANLISDHYEITKMDPEASFVRTGMTDLDNALGGGLQKSGLYIIGARPGMGKTTIGINIAENVARTGKAVLFVSLEMSTMQIMAKRVAAAGTINYTELMRGKLSDGKYKVFHETLSELMEKKFFCIDRSVMTVNDIAAAVRSVPDAGVQLLVVDYLGLIRAADETKKLYEQVTEISRDLKALAKRLNIPVLALCQVNRDSTKTKDKKPTLADLRDSGSIEQDADGVILLHRKDYYTNTRPDGPVIIDLIIAKNRHGEGNTTVEMIWNGATGKVSELDKKHKEEAYHD